MYRTATNAADEINRRYRDPIIRRRVNDFLGGILPIGLPDHPVAILPRQVATCRNEDLVFANQAMACGLQPWWPSYLADRYTVQNPEKVGYILLRAQDGNRLRKAQLVHDLNAVDKTKPALGSIVTNRLDEDGQAISLPSLHMRLRSAILPTEQAENVFDISEWFAVQAARNHRPTEERSQASRYYPAAIAFYCLYGVMWEDYHTGPNSGSIDGFRRRILEPAIEIVRREIDLDPLIVQLPYDPELGHYPAPTLAVLDSLEKTPKPLREKTPKGEKPGGVYGGSWGF